MRGKFNLAFQIDDTTGERIENCNVDVYIDCLHGETFVYIKNSLKTICDDIGNYILDTNTKGGL